LGSPVAAFFCGHPVKPFAGNGYGLIITGDPFGTDADFGPASWAMQITMSAENKRSAVDFIFLEPNEPSLAATQLYRTKIQVPNQGHGL